MHMARTGSKLVSHGFRCISLVIRTTKWESEGMADTDHIPRWTGSALLAGVALGIINALFVSPGIDINLNADFDATAAAMLEAETQLKARGWMLMAIFSVEVLGLVGLFLILRRAGALLAGWALALGMVAASFSLIGAVNAFAASELAAGTLEAIAATEGALLAHAAMETVTNYSSFHLALVLSNIAVAGFYWLFLRSGSIPKWIAGFGLFASLYVALAIVGRDFIAFLGSDAVTMTFMACNLLSILATGLYLLARGVQQDSEEPALT